jgi:integrase
MTDLIVRSNAGFVAFLAEMAPTIKPEEATYKELLAWIEYLHAQGMKPRTIRGRVTALSRLFWQKYKPEDYPTRHRLVSRLLGVLEHDSEPPRPRIPLSLEELQRLRKALIEEGTPLACRDRLLMSLSFCFLLRTKEVVRLTTVDLQVTATAVTLTSYRAKVPICKKMRPPLERTLPVDWLLADTVAWLTCRAQLTTDPQGPVFPGFSGKKLTGKALAVTTPLHIVKAAVQKVLGNDPAGYGMYSLRRGGVTFFMAQGVPLETIRLFGGWTSEAFLRYIDNAAGQAAPFIAAVLQPPAAEDASPTKHTRSQ